MKKLRWQTDRVKDLVDEFERLERLDNDRDSQYEPEGDLPDVEDDYDWGFE